MWATPQLNAVLNTICLEIDGFYFGRIDLMYHSIEELENGKNFSIVEINGAGSEPTHIYDPSHSLFFFLHGRNFSDTLNTCIKLV